MAQDPYKILGVSPTADESEIRRAHRRLAKRYHPDVAGGATNEKFRAIQDAYDILIDPEKRGAFDRSRLPQGEEVESPPERFGAQSAPRPYHVDLRNLVPRPPAEPVFSSRPRMGTAANSMTDPWDEIRRHLRALDEWFLSRW